MRKVTALGLAFFTTVAWGSPATDAQSTLHTLATLLKGKSAVETPGCPKIPGEKWLGLLVFQQPIHQKYVFTKQCDVQGDVTLKMTPFPADVALRHFPEGDRITATVHPELDPDFSAQLLHLTVRATEGRLYRGAEVILEFTARYQITSSLDGKTTKDQQGELQSTRYRGHTVKAQEKLTFP